MSWIVCAYFTKDTVYAKYAENFTASMKQFNIPHDVVAIDSKGSWYMDMQYKPTFLKQMLEKHYPYSVVYVDVDAIFCQYPEYFNALDVIPEVNIAAHTLDHSRYRRKTVVPELLSGTVFLKNTTITKQIVEEWIQECRKNPKLWDQCALATVLKKYRCHQLPEEYCTIFDYMASVKNPVIKHFQASRENRGRTSARKTQRRSNPRRVLRNGTVHIRGVD